jgi:type VI secretion system secreted protein Hcp
MAIFLNFNGNKPKGNVTADGYEGWIKVDDFQFAVSRGISMEPGNTSNREVTYPEISELTISKIMDGASTGLFKESLTGSTGCKVLIDIVKTGADRIEKFVAYELEDCLLSNYEIDAYSNAAPVESISISFAKITMSYTAGDRSNKAATPERVGYDLTAGKKL